jgi:hypothetical protein
MAGRVEADAFQEGKAAGGGGASASQPPRSRAATSRLTAACVPATTLRDDDAIGAGAEAGQEIGDNLQGLPSGRFAGNT